MLKRKAYDELLRWKNKEHRKALVIKGQRQVGKTFIVREFGKNEYKSFIEFDLSKNMDARLAFEGNLDVDTIIRGLSTCVEANFVPGETLIFLDEIQDFPLAWSAVKSFTQDGRYDVIASGSLLGIESNQLSDDCAEPLLPTGYQTFITMRPLDFEEFLWASGIRKDVIETACADLTSCKEIAPVIHKRLSDLFYEYMAVGGMPEAVQTYVNCNNYNECATVLDDILMTCHRDINRYNRGINKLKTSECFDSIPVQLSNTNKKFMYSRIDNWESRKSAEKYGDNLLWIKHAGLGLFCYNLYQPASPLKSNSVRDAFRIYMSDTGILTRCYGRTASVAILKKDPSFNRGALTENLVAICLTDCGYDLYYYRKNSGESKMELDFVIETEEGPLMIEVKSGKDRDAPSISKAKKIFGNCKTIMLEECQPHMDDDGMKHMPLYAAAFFDRIL